MMSIIGLLEHCFMARPPLWGLGNISVLAVGPSFRKLSKGLGSISAEGSGASAPTLIVAYTLAFCLEY